MFEKPPQSENKKESQDAILKNLLENPEVKSVIELRFFRHSIKETDPSKDDKDIELTDAGKEHAILQSENDTNINQAVAFGSPRKRTQETAMFVMSGQEEQISGEESFGELRDKLNEGVAIGSKIGINENLDFKEDQNSEYYKELISSFSRGYLKYLIEESDKRAGELGDGHSATYTRQAGQVAQIIKKYASILPRWSQLVEENPDKYTKLLERFMGTHQGVGESFLAKLMELYSGDTELRDKFVESLNNKGFDFVEGFKIYLADENARQPRIIVEYKHQDPNDPKKNFEFSKEFNYGMIDEIIEGENTSWF
jgi:broad specificity phosphatase PhoE